MPRARLPVSKGLILHLIHLAIALDTQIVRIAVVGRYIVTNDVPKRPPDKLVLIPRQDFTRALDVSPVFHLEGDVVQTFLIKLSKVNGVVVDAATHKYKVISNPIRDSEAQNILIKFTNLTRVTNA